MIVCLLRMLARADGQYLSAHEGLVWAAFAMSELLNEWTVVLCALSWVSFGGSSCLEILAEEENTLVVMAPRYIQHGHAVVL
jgi:hypothetical protein